MVDSGYLESAVYPVYVDPSTTDFPTASTTANDTFAASKYPNSNFKNYQRPDSPYYSELWHGREPGTSYYSEIFIKFNSIKTTLGTVRIEDAALEMYPYWQYYHYTARPTWVRQVLSSWDVSTLTWNTRPTVADNDLGPFMTTQGNWGDINVTSFVQAVVNDQTANYGLMLHSDDTGQGNWKRFISLNDTHTPDRTPHLSISWSDFIPSGLSPDGTNSASRTLTWQNDSAAAATTSYQVEVGTTSGGNDIAVSGVLSGAATTWTISSATTLTSGHTYYWHVRAKYGVNTSWSAWSANASFVYTSQLPQAWTLSPLYTTTDDRTLQWAYDDGDGSSATDGAQGQYQIQVATDSGFGTVVASSGIVTDSGARTWSIPTDVTLTESGTYFWRVKASNGATWSDWASATFGWSLLGNADNTGIDPNANEDYDLTAADLGMPTYYNPAYIDAVCDGSTCDAPAIVPTEGGGSEGYHQMTKKWCIPATVETMLYLLTSDKKYIMDKTWDAQTRLATLVLSFKDGESSLFYGYDAEYPGSWKLYVPSSKYGSNGVASNFGWQALNAELSRHSIKGYERIRPSSPASFQYQVNQDLGQARPVFTEVDIRDTDWVWHESLPSRSTHAVSVVSSHSTDSTYDIDDPYFGADKAISYDTTSPLHFNPVTYRPFTTTSYYGHVWSRVSLTQLFGSLDLNDLPTSKPLWY